MPKSRGRKRPKQQTIWQEGISPKEIVRRVLSSEQEAFKEKFGREWQPGDPIFFDPESDVPKPYPIDEARRILIEVMQMAKTPPEFIYAFKKTDMLLLKISKCRRSAAKSGTMRSQNILRLNGRPKQKGVDMAG
jgi:hypothetical protein